MAGLDATAPPMLGRQMTSLMDHEGSSSPHVTLHPKAHPAPAAHSPVVRSFPGLKAKLRYGVATDIGGGQTNQDAYGVFEVEADDCVVLGVYDGHGRELGELASQVARDTFQAHISEPGAISRLRASPKEELSLAFKRAHEAIRSAFRDKYKSAGWEVQDTDDGYLIKRQNATQAWTCTHGGTTATVVVILDGWRMIVANVGDSTALWGGIDPEGQVIFRELSAEHSPESKEEFERVRAFRPQGDSPLQPEMRFVYDAPSFSKSQCPPIFDVSGGVIRVTGNGRYYKNVRSEWATLVTTPPGARFQDALAFTRSLGDLHLHVYGVSFQPDVVEYDLCALHALVASPKTAGDPNPPVSVLLVCSDGIWDNWKYPDVIDACLQKDLVQPSLADGHAKKATDKLMGLNLKKAKENFGSQADNMTGILCHISF